MLEKYEDKKESVRCIRESEPGIFNAVIPCWKGKESCNRNIYKKEVLENHSLYRKWWLH